jgi:hypothetical protein
MAAILRQGANFGRKDKLWQNREDKLQQGGLTLAQINMMEGTKVDRGNKLWQKSDQSGVCKSLS